ncbi:MAG: hypothetical protein Q4A60_01865 [Pasteurellaceae bacterium]|nr:hypothetical protein [Pasteurellaceae bacterium]
MPIKFPELLQQSWNFMRNQTQFTLTGIGLLVALQLLSLFVSPQMQLSPEELNSPDAFEKVFQDQLLPMILSGVISVFFNILLVLNIKSINRGDYRHFFQNLAGVAKAFFPVIALTLVMVLPLSVGISFGGTVGQAGSLAILILPLMITGIYLFVKFCLVIYAYLIEEPQKTVGESIKFVWQLSRGKMRMLFLFCVISYLVPSLLSSFIGRIVGGDIGVMIAQVFGAALSLFMVIFGFRFYQAFRALPNY